MTQTQPDRPTALPSYRWCGVDPNELPDRADLRALVSSDLPPITNLFNGVGAELPRVSLNVADEPVVEVRDRRIRVLASYWHTGWPYATSRAWLREGAMQRLVAAAHALPDEFGVAIWDAWRDTRLQSALHEVAYSDPELPPGFVNPPSDDPQTPSPHASGGTVDLTLTYRGVPLALGTNFDDFLPTAHADAFEYAGADVLVRDLRRLLRSVMIANDFIQLDCEWWHFEYGTCLWAAIKQTGPRYAAAPRPQG